MFARHSSSVSCSSGSSPHGDGWGPGTMPAMSGVFVSRLPAAPTTCGLWPEGGVRLLSAPVLPCALASPLVLSWTRFVQRTLLGLL